MESERQNTLRVFRMIQNLVKVSYRNHKYSSVCKGGHRAYKFM